jgi:ribosomal-protein-alanine N-acetyltransferase
MSCCRLESERLLLRPPEIADVPRLIMLIGDYDVARNLGRVPHPYTQAHARDYLERSARDRAEGVGFNFAIERKWDGAYIGGCGLHLNEGVFEMGYWLGKPYWGKGYATEAAKRLTGFAFHDLKAERLEAGWFHDNPASGHVLEKLGARADGGGPRDCLARGHAVYCHQMLLERTNFGRNRVAA